jgi:FKBP-type peptidyl-prolyl cis-trans isomerase SlpA
MLLVDATSFLTLHYRVSVQNGQDIINTFGGKPATLQMGSGQLAPPLEEHLIGLPEGAEKTFAIENAYGERKAELVLSISRAEFDANVNPGEDYAPGDVVSFNNAKGQYSGVLKSLDATQAGFDFNHPLAGQTLNFQVNLIGVL